MTAVAFDTLKLARRLERAGFSREQADGTAEALTAEIATKSDLLDLKMELKGEIAEVRGEIAEVKGEIAEVKGEIAEVKGEIAEVKGEIAEVKGEIAEVKGGVAGLRGELRSEISALRTDTAKWIISAVFVNIVTQVGVVVAIWQFTHR